MESNVTEIPETRDSLLVQVRSPANREAWEEFAQIYQPVIYRLARLRGMQDADAQDLSQQVVVAVEPIVQISAAVVSLYRQLTEKLLEANPQAISMPIDNMNSNRKKAPTAK